MDMLKLRVFWAAFYGLLWLTFGGKVSLYVLFIHTIVSPVLFVFSRRVRANTLFAPYAWPFVRHDNPQKFGLDGARNISLTYESTFDKCTINLGIWHVLPKSSVNKHKFILNSGSKDELNKVFDDELKNSGHPVFLYFHGILGTRATTYRVKLYKLLQNLDAHVVTFDYRGFGDSTNVATTKIGAVEDGLTVYSWIRGLVGGDRPVFVWGHSLGSALAQRAFSKLKPYSYTLLGLKQPLPPPQGIVVEAGYNSNVDLSKDYTMTQFVNWIPHFRRVVVNTLRGMEARLIPEDYTGSLKEYPLLMMHSKNDGVIPYQYGKKLYEKHEETRKNGGAPLTFKTFETNGHFNICSNSTLPGIIEDFMTCGTSAPS